MEGGGVLGATGFDKATLKLTLEEAEEGLVRLLVKSEEIKEQLFAISIFGWGAFTVACVVFLLGIGVFGKTTAFAPLAIWASIGGILSLMACLRYRHGAKLMTSYFKLKSDQSDLISDIKLRETRYLGLLEEAKASGLQKVIDQDGSTRWVG
jgi:hypothetical protein